MRPSLLIWPRRPAGGCVCDLGTISMQMTRIRSTTDQFRRVEVMIACKNFSRIDRLNYEALAFSPNLNCFVLVFFVSPRGTSQRTRKISEWLYPYGYLIFSKWQLGVRKHMLRSAVLCEKCFPFMRASMAPKRSHSISSDGEIESQLFLCY